MKSWDLIKPECIKNGFWKSTIEFHGEITKNDKEFFEMNIAQSRV